jgi:uncharacterized membrane protein
MEKSWRGYPERVRYDPEAANRAPTGGRIFCMIQSSKSDVSEAFAEWRIAMLVYTLTYVIVLAVFVLLDGAWLSFMGPALYKPVLGDILADQVRLVPAVVFYLLYPVGIEMFVLLQALRSNSVGHAAIYGALFGLFAYATYDLTNAATLRQWTTQITLADIAWGTVATSLSATIAFVACRAIVARFDLSF